MSGHPKQLTVRLCPPSDWAAVQGRDAYSLLQAVGARPLFSPARRAWMTNGAKATDLLALADRRGYVIDYREVTP